MTYDSGPIRLDSEDTTRALAARIAPLLRAGDCILLDGPIGSGKSAFARALIRARAGAEIEVPSPTFTLVQSYDDAKAEIWHADLYRLTSPDEALELGLGEAFETAICLIEWPDRLAELAPETALTLHMAARDDHHEARFTGPAAWGDRLQHILS